jgi:hypothetical protein
MVVPVVVLVVTALCEQAARATHLQQTHLKETTVVTLLVMEHQAKSVVAVVARVGLERLLLLMALVMVVMEVQEPHHL